MSYNDSVIAFRAAECSILIQVGNMIVESAKQFASWSKDIVGAWHISAVVELSDGMIITIGNKAPQAFAFEHGSGIHGPQGEKYPIMPRNAAALVFPGTHEWSGQTIVTQLVEHPGVEARPFLHPANEQVKPIAMTMLKEIAGNAIKMTIREAWYENG
jgi:hypothetical protein